MVRCSVCWHLLRSACVLCCTRCHLPGPNFSLLPLFPVCCHYFQFAATKKNRELFCLPRLPVLFCGNNRISLLPSSYRPDFEDRLVIFCLPSSYKPCFEDKLVIFCLPSSYRPVFEDRLVIFRLPSSFRPVFEDGTEIFRLPSSYKPVFEDRHSVFADGGTPQLKMAHQTPFVAHLCGFLAHQTPFVAQLCGFVAHQSPSVAQLCGSVAHQTPSVAQSNSI